MGSCTWTPLKSLFHRSCVKVRVHWALDFISIEVFQEESKQVGVEKCIEKK